MKLRRTNAEREMDLKNCRQKEGGAEEEEGWEQRRIGEARK